MIETRSLPTHLAKVVARLNIAGPDASGDTFLATSYVSEALLKTIAIALCSGIHKHSPAIAYGLEYALVRADGLGTWEATIRACTGQSFAGYLDSELQPLVAWLTKRRSRPEDEWARQSAAACTSILHTLSSPEADLPRNASVLHLLSVLVRIRNKTKAHGAVGPDFFAIANHQYIEAVRLLILNCPLNDWDWVHITSRSGKHHVVCLKGSSPSHLAEHEPSLASPPPAGVLFRTHPRGQLFACGPLLTTTLECVSFKMPNGGFSEKGLAEFLDYASGGLEYLNLQEYLLPPAPLPPSATEGISSLDVYTNVFGNLPDETTRYVERPQLQTELTDRLLDRNHPIITLHGRGGTGKTSLALRIAHQLARADDPIFDVMIWLSARDLELKPSGATPVRRAVSNLEEVATLVGKLMNTSGDTSSFAKVLQDPGVIQSKGILYVFDNFETFDDPRGLHKFLDTHTHIPNKVLLTSRERAYKGDYPIEVSGMEYEEAIQLLRQEATALNIEPLLSEEAIEEIFNYTEGHAYVMRVLLGELARERRWLPPKAIIPRKVDLLNAVFERSFNRLSPEARRVFLCVANWRSAFPELGLISVLGLRDLDAEFGIEECVTLSLIMPHSMADSSFSYSAPELARVFGRKKLEGDPDRLVIQEDLEVLRRFGVLPVSQASTSSTQSIIHRFMAQCLQRIPDSSEHECQQMDRTIERCAESWPLGWSLLARFRREAQLPRPGIEYALRRAVEECPNDKQAWIERADYAKESLDIATRIASLVSAVDADPTDVELMRSVAFELCEYLDHHKFEIPPARRGVYLASVRSHMERVADRLDATGLSRLAWLFMMEGSLDGGWKYANLGLSRDATNRHCLAIVERLESQGYRPTPQP